MIDLYRAKIERYFKCIDPLEYRFDDKIEDFTQQIFELYFTQDQSLSKIAESGGISISQVSKIITRIKTNMQKIIS